MRNEYADSVKYDVHMNGLCIGIYNRNAELFKKCNGPKMVSRQETVEQFTEVSVSYVMVLLFCFQERQKNSLHSD